MVLLSSLDSALVPWWRATLAPGALAGTTEIYTYVSRRHIERIRSPFDELPGDEPGKRK